MSALTYAYEEPKESNVRHLWSVVGPLGGIHIWAASSPAGFDREEKYYGGVEVHSRKPMYGATEPSHQECWLLGGPCWHDGTSLYFSENIEPFLRRATLPFGDSIHEFVNAELLSWYSRKLQGEDR
ncbi:MAG: hypothetical protein DI533_00270 [Cereibacter sphaeroides]|uniref:Uncharacterized protein n=1 Tax=Cereibacter sphaeroides TaxID=1063 RepID=A0A2W5S883_CERSP|nr:MAG: hypothetical protein DI533_00270 [Cereibacter sphaeroides]